MRKLKKHQPAEVFFPEGFCGLVEGDDRVDFFLQPFDTREDFEAWLASEDSVIVIPQTDFGFFELGEFEKLKCGSF